VTKLQRKVLEALSVRSMTAEEVADHTNTALGSITPRMKPLRDAGLVVRLSEKRVGASNTPRYVEEITPKGRKVLQSLRMKGD
jgi:DNA-binding MarR family transcriptional regulator